MRYLTLAEITATFKALGYTVAIDWVAGTITLTRDPRN